MTANDKTPEQRFHASGWDEEITLAVAWGEMDAFGHVNNSVFLRWFESVRANWLGRVQLEGDGSDLGIVVRSASIEFLHPVTWPEHVTVRLRAEDPTAPGFSPPGGRPRSSIVLDYEASDRTGLVVATGGTRIVLVSKEQGGPVPIDDAAKQRIAVCCRASKLATLAAPADVGQGNVTIGEGDPDFIAGIIYGETSTVRAPQNKDAMAAARAWIAEIAFRRKDQAYQQFPKGVASSQ